jgi:hypothetical protein
MYHDGAGLTTQKVKPGKSELCEIGKLEIRTYGVL